MNPALAVALAYLVGSLPFGVILGSLIAGVDIRKLGSGNTGATNVLRTLGFPFALATFVLDAGKGVVAVLLARSAGGSPLVTALAGIAVVAGHNWTVFLRFKGGKGIATTFGFLIAAMPGVGLIFAGVWLAVILLSRYASLASLATACASPLASYLLGYDPEMTWACVVLAAFAVWRHRPNIKRLLAGTESKFGQRIR